MDIIHFKNKFFTIGLLTGWLLLFYLTATATCAPIPGDVDKDGRLSSSDLSRMESEIQYKESFSEADLSSLDITLNGLADSEDVEFLKTYLLFKENNRGMAPAIEFLDILVGLSTRAPNEIDSIIKNCVGKIDGKSKEELIKFLLRYIKNGGGRKPGDVTAGGFPPRDLSLILASTLLEDQAIRECSKYNADSESSEIESIKSNIQEINDVLNHENGNQATTGFVRTHIENAGRAIRALKERNDDVAFASEQTRKDSQRKPNLVSGLSKNALLNSSVDDDGLEGPASQRENHSENKGSSTLWILAILVVTISIAGIALLWFMKRKETQRPINQPKVTESPLVKGNRFLRNKHWDKAIAEFQKVLSSPYIKNPSSVRFGLASAFIGKDQYDAAATHIEQLDYTKVSADKVYQLASQLESNSQGDLALQIFTKIYAHKSDFKDVETRIQTLQGAQVSLGMFDVKALERKFAPRYGSFSVIGRGGMGAVFRVRDRQEQITVALKVILPEASAKENFRKRFMREIEALKSVRHPGIVNIFESGVKPVYHYFMEYVEGNPLSDFIGTPKLSKNMKYIISTARNIAETLAFVHSKDILHRDIKPDNILITRSGDIKLLDFGIARLDDSTLLTVTGEFIGTMAYASPEVFGVEGIDKSSDVFSFGVLLYEMICEKRPWTSEQLLLGSCRCTPSFVSKIVPDCPKQLAQLVSDCIEVRKINRIQNFNEVLGRLEGL